jgi:hypothetical protein
MTRGTRLVALLTVCAALCPTTRAAALPGCDTQPTWQYCGAHWRASSLPVRFRVNPAGAPLSASTIGTAINGAVNAWNLAWPGVIGHDTDPSPALRNAGTTSSGFGRDGQNTISFGDPTVCGGADALAVACIWYEGASGASASRIAEVDIVINPAVNWRQASAQQQVAGEAAGVTPYAGCAKPWQDVQSTLAHEFGHALGLRHVGDASAWFPADGRDVASFTQTMYRWDYPCATNKRTLDSGDVAGLQEVARATYAD